MAGNGDSVPSSALANLSPNASTLDDVVNSGESTTLGRFTPEYPSGKPIRTLAGIQAEAQEILNNLGLEYPPIAYVAGLTVERNTQTYRYNDVVYVNTRSDLPFTTTGAFDEGGWQVVQQINQSTVIFSADGIKGLEDAPKIDRAAYSVAGFYAGAEVGGGQFIYDTSRDKADHNGGTVITPEAIAAWDGTQGGLSVLLDWTGTGTGAFVRANYKYLTPEMFGAIADNGVTDNKLPIDACAALSEIIILPDSKFGTSGRHTFTNAVFSRSQNKSGFINLDTSGISVDYLITIQNLENSFVGGFTVDGSATVTQGSLSNDDPASWDSTNYDSFYGARGIRFDNCKNIYIPRILAKNIARSAGIRGDSCENMVVEGCRSERIRGESGDGFYFRSCKNIQHVASTVFDFTRIGFTSEGSSPSGLSNDISYDNCVAEFGHDQSIDYGGSEYNVGFWNENTENVTAKNCRSVNTTYGGFLHAATPSTTMNRIAITYENCKAFDTDTGFRLNPLQGSPDIGASYENCFVFTSNSAFESVVRDGTEVDIDYVDCYHSLTGATANSVGYRFNAFLGATINASIENPVAEWDSLVSFDDSAANTADVSEFEGAGTKNINIVNPINKTSGAFQIKNRVTAGINYTINAKGNAVGINSVPRAGNVNLIDGEYLGSFSATKAYLDKVSVGDALLRIIDAEVYGNAYIGNGAYLYVLQNSGVIESKKIAGRLDLTVERDITTKDYALRLQCEQATKPNFTVAGTYYNTNATAAATDKNFIWAVRSGTAIISEGVVKDSNVPNMYRIGTSPDNFAVNQQDVVMH